MDKNEILNRISLENHGAHFNQIHSMHSRAVILDNALDEVIAKLKDHGDIGTVISSDDREYFELLESRGKLIDIHQDMTARDFLKLKEVVNIDRRMREIHPGGL